MKTISINSINELKHWLKDFLLPQLKKKQVILLNGPMGVGKTELVKNLVKLLGGQEAASSPTFALHNEYPIQSQTDLFDFVDHIDLYRLESEDELESMGFWDLFNKEQGLLLIEWAQRIDTSFLPSNWSQIEIEIKALDSGQRLLSVKSNK